MLPHIGHAAMLMTTAVAIWMNTRAMVPIPSESQANGGDLVHHVCQAAQLHATKANFIYSAAKMSPATFAFEVALHGCLHNMTAYRLYWPSIRLEPLRDYSTLSLFTLPGEWNDEWMAVQLQRMLNAKQRNKHAHKYIFVWIRRRHTQTSLEGLFKLLWSKGILNVVAFNGSRNSVYTYEPFTASRQFELRRLSQLQPKMFFYDKLRNLQHHQLRISMFPDHIRAQPNPNTETEGYTAVDGLVASTVAKLLNATARYFLPQDDAVYGNCSRDRHVCSGTLGDIASHRTDVGFNMRYAFAEDAKYVEVLYPLYARKLSLVVPASEMRPESLLFVRAFTNGLWRLLLFNFVIACGIIYLLQQSVAHLMPRGCARGLRCSGICILIFKLQFGEPLQPSFTHVNCLRMFVVSWILCSYVVTSVYFAKLESSFVHKTYEPDLSSVAEFEKYENVPIYVVDGLLQIMRPQLDENFRWILERAIPVPMNYSGFPYGLAIVRKSTNVAFIFRREIARDFLANTFNTATGRPRFHSIPQYIFSMPRSYIVPLGSPYRHKFEFLVMKLFEFGLLQCWLNTFVSRRQHDSQRAQEFYEALGHNVEDIVAANEYDDEAGAHPRVALSVEILQGAFYLWSFGITISLVAFVMEHLCSNWRSRH